MHELQNTKPHSDRDGEPRPDALDKVPRPPQHLNDRAAKLWRQDLPELIRWRLITKIDIGSLAGYFSALATAQEADERLKTEKWTTSTARGGSRPSPLFKIRDDALRLVAKFAADFGFTPSTRSRVKGAQAPQQDAFGGFLDEGRAAARRRDENPSRVLPTVESTTPPEEKWN
jgi:P27 family predicted phage terminase small subunit